MLHDISKLTSKVDQATAKSAELKEHFQAIQYELAALAKEQAELDKIPSANSQPWQTWSRAWSGPEDLEQGLDGVPKALSLCHAAVSAVLLQAEPSASMQQLAAPAKHSKVTGAGSTGG